MTRSAAGVDYNPFQFFQRLVLTRPREVYYIGGSDVLPAPLEPKREAYVISKLDTDQHQEAKAILIEHNLRLVVYIAKKFDNTGVGVEDLISIGTIGLIKAINTFNPDKNIKLATYASRCIENEILMYLRSSADSKKDAGSHSTASALFSAVRLLLSGCLIFYHAVLHIFSLFVHSFPHFCMLSVIRYVKIPCPRTGNFGQCLRVLSPSAAQVTPRADVTSI